MIRKLIALLLLYSVPMWATITFTKAGGTQDAGSTPTVQVTVPTGGHPVGSLITLCFATSNDPGTTTVDDNASGAGTTNTWTIDRNFFDTGNTAGIIIAHSVLTKAMVAGNVISVHPTNQTDSNLYTAEFASTAGFVSAADTTNQFSNTFGTPWLPGSVTPTASASIVMIQCATSDNNTGSSAPTSPAVEDFDHNGTAAGRGLIVQHQIVSSATGSYNVGGTWSASNDGPAAVAVLKESSASSAPLTHRPIVF